MKLASIRTNPDAVEEGRWIGDIPGLDDLRLKVRGGTSKVYKRRLDELVNAIPKAQRLRALSDADNERITVQAMAETLLLDWENLEGDGVIGEAGQPVPYSRETAVRLLSDPQYAAFRNAVFWAADAVGVDAQASVEADVKNSRAFSPGS